MRIPPDSVTCRLVSGSGTAARYLQPMLDAWASTLGLRLFPGTANGCALRQVQLPKEWVSLADHSHLMSLDWRREMPGYDPRLYPARINGDTAAWLYRWSEDDAGLGFAGDNERCRATRFMEFVSLVNLRQTLFLEDGSEFRVEFS